MNQTTKKQHYVWRNYLSAWTQNKTSTGRIMCLRNNHIFPVSLMNIAHENYFYEVREMSKQERNIIYAIAIANKTGTERQINEQWLNLYCLPFDFANAISEVDLSSFVPNSMTDIKQNPTFKDFNIEVIERLHAQIESTGTPYISLLRQNDLEFLQNEEDRDKFSFFLTNQYFRTKKTRDAVIKSFKICQEIMNYFPDIHPENIWLPLSLIFASKLGVVVSQNYSAVLLRTEEESFIVGDQPVINTYSTFNMATAPEKMELFYPITPHTALLLTDNEKYLSGQVVTISSDETIKYNELESKSAHEMIFAEEEAQLVAFVKSKE